MGTDRHSKNVPGAIVRVNWLLTKYGDDSYQCYTGRHRVSYSWRVM